jgi:hypothetical protein
VLAASLIAGCGLNGDAYDRPVAVCDLDDDEARRAITDLLDRNAIKFRSEPFGEGSEGRVFFVFVDAVDMTTTATLIADHAAEHGYKVTVHFGDDTPSRWINHDEPDATPD